MDILSLLMLVHARYKNDPDKVLTARDLMHLLHEIHEKQKRGEL